MDQIVGKNEKKTSKVDAFKNLFEIIFVCSTDVYHNFVLKIWQGTEIFDAPKKGARGKNCYCSFWFLSKTTEQGSHKKQYTKTFTTKLINIDELPPWRLGPRAASRWSPQQWRRDGTSGLELAASKQPPSPRQKLHRGRGDWGSGSDRVGGHHILDHGNAGNLPRHVGEPG